VGAPTVTLHLSELQAVTGTTASDRATFVSIRLSEEANASAVREELQTTYPEYTVRTNEQQLRATLEGKAVVIASGVSLVALAVVAGVLLLTNLQLSYVYRHRRTLGALTALGMSRLSLLGLVLVTTLLIGLVGGLVAVGASIPATWAINRIVTAVVGVENVVAVSERFLLAGLAGAVAVSVAAGLVAGLYLFRLRPLDQLR
jgi:putative ABC transport system permease protein